MKDGVLTGKYGVIREDGRGHRPSDRFFVLNYASDPYARAAMLAYADACESTHPVLAEALRQTVELYEQRDAGRRRSTDKPVRGAHGSAGAAATGESLVEIVRAHAADPEFRAQLAEIVDDAS